MGRLDARLAGTLGFGPYPERRHSGMAESRPCDNVRCAETQGTCCLQLQARTPLGYFHRRDRAAKIPDGLDRYAFDNGMAARENTGRNPYRVDEVLHRRRPPSAGCRGCQATDERPWRRYRQTDCLLLPWGSPPRVRMDGPSTCGPARRAQLRRRHGGMVETFLQIVGR